MLHIVILSGWRIIAPVTGTNHVHPTRISRAHRPEQQIPRMATAPPMTLARHRSLEKMAWLQRTTSSRPAPRGSLRRDRDRQRPGRRLRRRPAGEERAQGAVRRAGRRPGGFAHSFNRGPYTFDSAIRVIAEGEMIEQPPRLPRGHRPRQPDRDRSPLPRRIPRHEPLRPDRPGALHGGAHPGVPGRGGRHPALLRAAAADLPRCRRSCRCSSARPNSRRRWPASRPLFKYRTATLEDVLDDHFTDPKLKALCSALWPYMGSPPSRLSFFAYSQFLGVLIDGPFYCQGSFQSLVDAFITALTRDGGELVLKRRATKILVEDGQAAGRPARQRRDRPRADCRLQRRRPADLRAAGRRGAPADALHARACAA